MTTFAKIVIAIDVVLALAIGVIGYKAYNGNVFAGYYPTNYSSLFVTPNAANGDTYTLAWGATPYSAATTLIDSVGNWVGNIVQSSSTGVAVLNDVVQGSFSSTNSTSTTLTPAQFCANTNQRWLGTTALATATLPAATSSFAVCGGSFGAWNLNLVTNDSTNTVDVVAGTGMTFRCETNGVGTTTIIGGCTSSLVAINPTSTVQFMGYWDGASSTMTILVGNEWH